MGKSKPETVLTLYILLHSPCLGCECTQSPQCAVLNLIISTSNESHNKTTNSMLFVGVDFVSAIKVNV